MLALSTERGSPMSELSAPVRAALAGILEPLQAELVKANAEVELLERQLAQAREERKTIERVLKAADPLAKPGPKPKGQQAAGPWDVSTRVVDELQDYVKEHYDRYSSEGFYASGLLRDRKADGLRTPSDATINKALRALHDRGAIRLVKQGNGGARIYKLVS
jgi:hypothetical protein